MAFKSYGASFDILIHFYNIDSGIILSFGYGGGSDDIKIQKSSYAPFNTISNSFSKSFNHDYIKWTFYKNNQFPFLAHSFNKLIAFYSYP